MSKTQKALAWGAVIICFWLLLALLKNILLPFVAGMLLAYFVDPVTTRLEKLKMSRMTAATIVSIICVAIFLIAVIIVIPILKNQILWLIDKLPFYTNKLITRVSGHLPEETIAKFKSMILDNVADALKFTINIIKELFVRSIALFNLLSLIFITPVVAFYMLRDFNLFKEQIESLLPVAHKETILRLFSEMDTMINGFIRGQIMVCIIVAIYYSVSLSLIGIDVGLLLGLFCGCIAFIPYLGWSLGFAISMLLAIASMSSPTDYFKPAAVVVIFIISQLCESNILIPKLVGDNVNLHPVWIIFALLAGGTLFGFLGVLISLPAAAAIGVLVRFAKSVYLKSSLYASK